MANFPLPILTGIGHDRDESVVDMVAAVRCKTPTAVAAFLVETMMDLEAELTAVSNGIVHALRKRLSDEEHELEHLSHALAGACRLSLQTASQQIGLYGVRLSSAIRTCLLEESHRLEMMEKSLSLVSPEAILKKGYSLTMCGGKAVSSVAGLRKGDTITTYLRDGKVESVINKCEEYEEGNVL